MLLFFFGVLFIQTVFFAETINSSSGINQLLSTGEKRVAIGTNLNPDFFHGRFGLKTVAAGTRDRRFIILWMYLRFHIITPKQSTFLNAAV
jgi:hypothetical protein